MTRESGAGSDGRISFAGAGSSRRIDDASSAGDCPRNGRTPVASSYKRIPSEKMSVRWSIAAPDTCSGDMYAGVPRMAPAEVAKPVDDSLVNSAACIFARPKSSTFTTGASCRAESVRASITLPGFRSRWTKPARWAAARASASCVAIRNVSSSDRGFPSPWRANRAASVSPSRCSITRNSTPSTDPTSCRVQMLGWDNPPIVRASRSKRARCSGSARRGGRILIATVRSNRVSRAL